MVKEMKSYKIYINESDYLRFLKNNKNLSKDQQEKINVYFSRTNKQAGSEIDWQSKKVRNMTYDDFENIILNYKSGFSQEMKVNVPGKKGEDYIQIKLKNKKFLAYIPLNWKTANFFNSAKYGMIETGHCIGWNRGDNYWKQHVLKEKKMPIYLIGGNGKWVIMIKKDNKSYEVWDKFNKEDSAIRNKEPIPNFNIRKELLTSSLKKLYSELRETKFIIIHFIYRAKIKNANYEIDDKDFLTWEFGTWKSGIWEDGIWKDGTWEFGIWEQGIWEKGIWKDGIWKGGTWEGRTWESGTWESGTWKYGIWEKGNWEYGFWKSGTWKHGTWWNGNWEYGFWEKGTWKNGTWEFGTWKNGIWEFGTWKDGTWKNGTWKDGIWEGGTWEDGIWKNGTWEGGIWESGIWESGYDKDGNFHGKNDSPNKW